MKLSQTACRHPWPHPSITLGPAPVCNPSLAGVLSAHSILLMPCRHTANPSPPPVSLDSAETAFAIKKKKCFPCKHSHHPLIFYVQLGIWGAVELLAMLNISSEAKLLCVWRMSCQMEMHPWPFSAALMVWG